MFSNIKYNVAKERVENWQLRADADLEKEPVTSFISSWIAFNHLYATHAQLPESQFKAWTIEQSMGRGDRAALSYFFQSEEIDTLLTELNKIDSLKDLYISLPVRNVLRETNVPNDIEQKVKLLSLSKSDLFLVNYQVRNNLFHGSKDPLKSKRDDELCKCTALFLYEFNKAFIAKYF